MHDGQSQTFYVKLKTRNLVVMLFFSIGIWRLHSFIYLFIVHISANGFIENWLGERVHSNAGSYFDIKIHRENDLFEDTQV